jgi:hypothetical protein
VPPFHLGTKPQARTTTAKIEDWTRHVRVAVLILAHGVAVGQAEDPGHVASVHEVVNKDSSRHAASLHVTADAAYTREHHSVRWWV